MASGTRGSTPSSERLAYSLEDDGLEDGVGLRREREQASPHRRRLRGDRHVRGPLAREADRGHQSFDLALPKGATALELRITAGPNEDNAFDRPQITKKLP